MCASDSQRPRYLLDVRRRIQIMGGALVAICDVWMPSILTPFFVVRNPSVDLVAAHFQDASWYLRHLKDIRGNTV